MEPFECRVDANGASCQPAYVLRFLQPAQNQAFNGPSADTVNFEVEMLRVDGGFPSLTTIPFACNGLASAPGSLSLGAPGRYTGSAALPLNTARPYTAVAGWSGALEATVDFSIERLLPQVSLVLPSNGPFPRDAIVPVRIASSEALATISLTLTGTDGGVAAQVTTGVPNTECGATGVDRCGRLDFSTPPMGGGLTGTFTASVSVTDLAGNANTNSLAGIGVTRVRWRASVAGGVRAAPALDKEGNLFIGTQDTDTTGRLVSLGPDGGLRFSTSVGAVQSIAIAETDTPSTVIQELAWFVVTDGASSSALRTLTTTGASASLAAQGCVDSARRSFSALALLNAGITGGRSETAALMSFNPDPNATLGPGALCTFGPRRGANLVDFPGLIQPEVDGFSTFSPVNLVVSGNKAWVQVASPNPYLQYIDLGFSGPANGGSGAGFGLGTFPTGLAIGSGWLVGSWGWGGTPLRLPVATYPLDNLSNGTTTSGTTWAIARPPAILAGSVVSGTNKTGADWLYSQTPAGAALGTPSPVTLPTALNPNSMATTVVVGTDNRVYSVRRNGELFVYDGAAATGVASLTPVWSGQLFVGASPDVVAHPTLDCSRIGTGRPGTLYAVSRAGEVTAVIVDSTKLDPTSPWPKWQRTAGNAGNPAFPLNPGCP